MIKNVIANYISKLWVFASIYLFIPIYIKFLGVESYGVINFYTVILSILLFADAGLSATLSREFARSTDRIYSRNLLHTIERLYFVIIGVIIIALIFFSDTIVEKYLHSNLIPKEKLSICVKLMGVGIAFQFITTLYYSGLMGLQKQVLANTINVFWSFFRTGIVLVLLYIYPSLYTFFIWQIISNIIFFLIMRLQLWKEIKADHSPQFKFEIIKTVGKFALGMMAMSIISSLNTQVDKLVVSKYLSLEQFGLYSLAAVISQISILVITPLSMAILPNLTKHVEEKKFDEIKKIFNLNSYVVSTIVSITTIALLMFTKEIIYIWTGNEFISKSLEIIVKVLLLGSSFLALQFMPYILAISNGHTKTNIKMGIVTVIIIIPSLIYCINKFGLIGATYPWLILNFISTFCLGYFILKMFMKGEFNTWLFKNTILPFVISGIPGFIIYYLTKDMKKGIYVIGYCIVFGLSALFCNLLAYNFLNKKNRITFNFVNK